MDANDIKSKLQKNVIIVESNNGSIQLQRKEVSI